MDFAKQYKKFLTIIQLISHIKPAWFSSIIAANYAVFASPVNVNRNKALQNLKYYLGPEVKEKKIWQQHLKQHGIATLSIFNMKRLRNNWSQQQVTIRQPDVFEQFCQNKQGGVVLTFHVQHQHRLFAILGLQGLAINPLAAAPQSSPLYAELKEYINLLHHNASQYFGNGDYIFLKSERINVRPAYRALSNKQIVVSLSDNVGADDHTENVLLFDKPFKVSSGIVKVAKKQNLPVWVALVYWLGKDNFALEIQKLDSNKPVKEIMQDYINFLQNILIKKPEIWEGWQW
jgi:lauroyl/myristoyl acyltransferase